MKNFFLGILFLLSMQLHAEAENSQIYLDFKFNIEKNLKNSLLEVINKLLMESPEEEVLKEISDFLKETYFIAESSCYINKNKSLFCSILPKRVISFVKVKNLSAALLESELKRKLPVQLGQMVDFRDSEITKTLSLVQSRTKAFLEKHGYNGAAVQVTSSVDDQKGTGQININIIGGNFARVINVDVVGEAPISRLGIQKAYRRMGVSLNQIAFWFGVGASYYSRELERQTTENLLGRLAKLGYVQSRIRVSHKWIDPLGVKTAKQCRSRDNIDVTPKCINLGVEIIPGPKVSWEFNFEDNKAVDRNGLERFIASLMASEQLYRIFISRLDDEQAFDHKIISQSMEDQVTFISSATVNDMELSESAEKIRKYLVSRGYTNAQVAYKIERKNLEYINIKFDIFTHDAYHVQSVRVFPEVLASFVTKEKLDTLISARTLASPGIVSIEKIKDTVPEVVKILTRKGFQNVNGRVVLEKNDDSSVNVVFYMNSAGRKIVHSLKIKNGKAKLNSKLLPKLRNCDSYKKLKNSKLSSCYSSSLIADQVNEDAKYIAEFYRNEGYLYTEVTPILVDTPEGADIEFVLYDQRNGPTSTQELSKQKFQGFIFSGFKKTRHQVIRRLFYRNKINTDLNPQGLKQGISLLRESGRFSRIDHKLIFTKKDSDDVYFMLQAVERPSLSIDIGARFSTDHLFSLEAELEEQNLFSSILRLNTALSLGLFIGRRSTLNNRFQWPYILGLPLKFTINAPVIIYENRPLDLEPFRRLKSKISTNIEWRATKNLIPYIRYWLSSTQEQRGARFVPIGNIRKQIVGLDGLISTVKLASEDFRGVLKPGFSYMRLDNPYDPRLGVHTNNWVELSGGPFFGDPNFINIGTQNRFFIPMGATTLAVQTTFMRAFMTPSEKNWLALKNGSSMDKLGGDRNIRGYDFESIGITASSKEVSKFAGYFSNIANIELRFPLTKEQKLGNFSGAIFVDQGSLLPCESLISCFENKSISSMIAQNGFALSVGAAIRYALPVGPISLDYAISPIHAGRWRIHLLFGYAF